VIALLAVAVGGFAASRYNEGATVFLKSPSSEEIGAQLIFASDLKDRLPQAPQ
jgi:hypothetical protein